MVYITGDTNGIRDIGKLLTDRLRGLTKNDYVIICGDGGVLSDPKDKDGMLALYSYLPFTVLFVDGDRDNSSGNFPQEIWHGGKVRRLADSVFLLMRGQVFDLEGEKYFVFGGARSFDAQRLKDDDSRRPQEMRTESDFNEAKKNLAAVSNKIDYVISYDCPESLLKEMTKHSGESEPEVRIVSNSNKYLEELGKILDFKHWYFAHYHCDTTLGKYDCVFARVIEIKKSGKADTPTMQEKQRSQTNADEFCPNCHHHCHRDSVRCNRGRMYFSNQNTSGGEIAPQQDRLLLKLANLKRKYDKSARKNQAFNCLSDCEKNILIELLRKIEESL